LISDKTIDILKTVFQFFSFLSKMTRQIKDDRIYWVGFSHFKGVGPKRFGVLLKKFGSAKKAFAAKKEDLEKILGLKLAHDFDDFRGSFDLTSYFLRVRENRISIKIMEDVDYPENLKKIDNPPIVLYIKGKLEPQDRLAVAVVGTRLPTQYGKKITRNLVADLVVQGITIVSGLAYGVDSIAHKTAIECGGRTIAVLGGGLDKIYPGSHVALAEEVTKHGALVSEFGLGAENLRGNFPSRNRIISGLSLGVLVTEGSRKSGTKITADWAKKQGRPIFAVPGPITSEMSKAPFELLKMGARLVESVDDVIEGLGLKKKEVGRLRDDRKTSLIGGPVKMTKEEKKIIEILKSVGECHFNKIVRLTGWSAAKVGSILAMMEIKGLVKVENGVYNIEE
jgi:DNA processing protein